MNNTEADNGTGIWSWLLTTSH